jgi:hypothetical protein
MTSRYCRSVAVAALIIAILGFIVAATSLTWQIYTQRMRYRVLVEYKLKFPDGSRAPVVRVENLGGRPFAVNAFGAADADGDLLLGDVPLDPGVYPYKTIGQLPMRVGPGETVQWAVAYTRAPKDVAAIKFYVTIAGKQVEVIPGSHLG